MSAYPNTLWCYARLTRTTLIICLAVLVCAFVVGARLWLTEASTRSGATANAEAASAEVEASKTQGQNPRIDPSASTSDTEDRIRRSLIPLHLRPALTALGDRIEKPGKERLTIRGTLKRMNDERAVPFVAIYQQPSRLRVEEARGANPRITTFDGSLEDGVSRNINAEEEILIEMLIYDSAEGFFNTQMDRAATRFLGTHFRTDDGTTPDYAGPYYDIYQVTDQVKSGGVARLQSKLYLFNSDTHLLELIRYTSERNGMETQVEVQLGDWQKSQDQQIPRRIVRLENGEPVLTLTMTQVVVAGAGTDNSIFSRTQN